MTISISELFNVLNLLARIGLVVYLVRRYGISKIQAAMIHEKTDLQLKQQQHAQLQQACVTVNQQIAQDQQLFETMKSKFATWNQQVEKNAQQQQQEHAKRQQHIQQLLEKKIEYVQRRHVIEVEVAQLLAQVQNSLEQQFSNSADLGKKYQKKLLEMMP